MNNLVLESKNDITIDAMEKIVQGTFGYHAIENISVNALGTGQMSEAYRVTLDYENNSGQQLPSTFVVKIQSDNESSRQIGKAGFYLREVKFYQSYSEHLNGIVPKCYYAAIDDTSQSFTLVLEDMSPAEQGDQLQGCNLEEAKVVITSLAKVHALTWGDSKLDNLYWLADTSASRSKEWIYNLNGNLFKTRWEQFCVRFNGKLNDDDFLIGKQLVQNFDRYMTGTTSEMCLAHGDLRSDNLLFYTTNELTKATIVDWQVAGLAPGAKDLAYFMGTSLPTELRRKHEEQLLQLYLTTLKSLGISNYSLDQLHNDYRFYSFSGFVMAVAASMEVEQTERGDDMFMKMLSLPCELIRDSNALTLLQ